MLEHVISAYTCTQEKFSREIHQMFLHTQTM